MFNVCEYGIINDGASDNTDALRALIEKMSPGGGTLYFPPGKYLTGSVELKSNMTLYLDAGAELLASGDRSRYPIIDSQRIPGLARRGYAGVICAFNAENICVKGEGTINGQGVNWWFGGPDGTRKEDDYMRPRSIYFVLCRNVRISGIRMIDSPCWTVHPLCCENVSITSVSIKNPPHSPNTDGINPESCRNVRISDCDIDVGDDCVTIKAGTENDPLQKLHPCENITVTGCTMSRGHGGVVIGSEMSGGVRNVAISNCVFRGTDRGVRIKTRRGRAGSVKNILINGLIMDGVGTPVTVNCYYRCGADMNDGRIFAPGAQPLDETTPEISGIRLRAVCASGAKFAAMYFLGLPERPVEDVSLADVDIEMDGSFGADEPIMTPMHEKTCAAGVFMKNVRGLSLSGVRVKNARGELFVTENCENISGEVTQGKN